MSNSENQTVALPPLKPTPAANNLLCKGIINLGPLALHTSLKQVHDMALYHAPELAADDIAALFYVEQIRLLLLHYAEAVGDVP